MKTWNTHCKSRYPREFATPTRVRSPLETESQLNKFVQAYTPGHNCYVSVYSFSEWYRHRDSGKLDYSKAIIDTIFIDLDWKENPEIALYDARQLDWSCRHKEIIPRIYFTGNKGFAVYLDFPPVALKDELKKPVIRMFIEQLKDRLSLKTLDKQCIDGISRVSRIPNTKHHGTGLYCIPLSKEQLWDINGIKPILEIAKNPSNTEISILESKSIPNQLLTLQEVVEQQPQVKSNSKAPVPFISVPKQRIEMTAKGAPCPGVMEIISGVQEGSRDSCLCGLIAGFSLQMGLAYEEIMQAMSDWLKKCTPPLMYDLFTLSNKVTEISAKQYRPCTFLIRTGVKACNNCSVRN